MAEKREKQFETRKSRKEMEPILRTQRVMERIGEIEKEKIREGEQCEQTVQREYEFKFNKLQDELIGTSIPDHIQQVLDNEYQETYSKPAGENSTEHLMITSQSGQFGVVKHKGKWIIESDMFYKDWCDFKRNNADDCKWHLTAQAELIDTVRKSRPEKYASIRHDGWHTEI